MEGKTYKEIATSIGRTPKAVKERLNKEGICYRDFLTTPDILVCQQCGEDCINKHAAKFCSRSCSATFNNTLKPKRVRQKPNTNLPQTQYFSIPDFECKICGCIYNKRTKYCSKNCYEVSRKNDRKHQFENGMLSSISCRTYLIKKHGTSCWSCDWSGVNPTSNLPIIELEHKDGDSTNNKPDNLELLCPNCHAMTPTYKALNMGKGRHKRMQRYTDGKSF